MSPVRLFHLTLVLAAASVQSGAGEVLRIAGNPELAGVVARWATGFQQAHPEVQIETHLSGSDTGMAFLYTGRADLVLLGRSPTPSEIQAFEWVFRYKPAQVEVLNGSASRAGRSPALVVFVHRDNPLTGLTLAQLEAVFGTEHRLGPRNIRTWGELGLTAEWQDQSLRLYGPDAMSGTGRHFRAVVLNHSRLLNWEQLVEFADTQVPLARNHDAGRRIIAALARDRFGLAVASLDCATPQVRALPLAGIMANEDTVRDRNYPLSRVVFACYNRQPTAAPAPLVRDFLSYVLGPEGGKAVASDDGYLPLTPDQAAAQRKQLE